MGSIWRGDYKYNDELTMVSCPVTSLVECSRDWTNLTKMLLLPYVCLDRTMTVRSPVSGCLKVMNSLLSWMTIGRLTTLAITGRSLTASQMIPKSWWINTGSGKALTKKEEHSTRARFSNKLVTITILYLVLTS